MISLNMFFSIRMDEWRAKMVARSKFFAVFYGYFFQTCYICYV